MLRVTLNKWLVIPTKDNVVEWKTAVIPKFYRVRQVVIEDNVMKCSCTRTNVYGDICIHVLKVANSSTLWEGPTHHHFSVIWWKKYTYFATLNSSPRSNDEFDLCNALKRLTLTGVSEPPLTFDFIRVKSYSNTESTGDVKIESIGVDLRVGLPGPIQGNPSIQNNMRF